MTLEKSSNPISMYNLKLKTLNIYRNISNRSDPKSISDLTEIRIGDDITIPVDIYDRSNLLDCNSKTLERLTLGSNIDNVPYSLQEYSKLESITLTTPNPPHCPYFSTSQYMNIVVTVPMGSLELYQQAKGWKNFWELREADTSGIDDITADSSEKTEIGRYDLFGRKVSDSQKGFVIIKYSDGSTKKTLIK